MFVRTTGTMAATAGNPLPDYFFLASRRHLLRLDRTVYIGDDPRDCVAAVNANCPCVYVGEEFELASLKRADAPAHVAKNILCRRSLDRGSVYRLGARWAAGEGFARVLLTRMRRCVAGSFSRTLPGTSGSNPCQNRAALFPPAAVNHRVVTA